MLEKCKNITYAPATGQVQFDDKITFMEGDRNISILRLRGELHDNVKVQMKVKPPQGKVQTVEGKICKFKGYSREFLVPTDTIGIHECQIIMSYSYETNVSEVFQYEVKESLK